MERLTQYLVDI